MKDCPFCGGNVECRRGADLIKFFLCDGCGAVVSFRAPPMETTPLTFSQAVAAWNSRAPNRERIQ